ncbi:hypothetical protein NPIL_15441 [Nephila pilipes]|uniref:Uncharacterized protein n=1 Tax=Nephila pilipes TaxID=299642 RepID=A0A8X6UAD4_NEPPI|nr:hypothetical protein NPIL_15441 [Nephila pilipes]
MESFFLLIKQDFMYIEKSMGSSELNDLESAQRNVWNYKRQALQKTGVYSMNLTVVPNDDVCRQQPVNHRKRDILNRIAQLHVTAPHNKPQSTFDLFCVIGRNRLSTGSE